MIIRNPNRMPSCCIGTYKTRPLTTEILKFIDGYQTGFDSASHMYHKLNAVELAAPGARVTLIEDQTTGAVVAGARAVKKSLDGIYIGQAFTVVHYRGYGLIGYAVDHLRLSFFYDPDPGESAITKASLVVRIRDGNPDKSARRAYQKIGFLDVEDLKCKIEGTSRDRHLRDTADTDGGYSTLLMTADETSLLSAASRIEQRFAGAAA